MSKTTGKRGFVAPQAQPSTSFEGRLVAWRNASAALNNQGHAEDDEVDRLASLLTAAEDAVIGTPAATPQEIADKVNVLFSRWVGGGPLSDPQVQIAVARLPSRGFTAGDERDFAQSLLAVFLDLTAPPKPAVGTTRFDALKAAYEQADAAEVAAFAKEREAGVDLSNDELDRLLHDRTEALWALMLEPAPSLDALAWKLEHAIDVAHTDYVGESAKDAATISRLLGDKAWDGGCIPAVALQDVLRLAGRPGPVTEAKPNPFDAGAFLRDLRDDCGAAIYLDRSDHVRIEVARRSDGPCDLVTATNRWEALTDPERDTVRHFIERAAAKRAAE